MEVKTVPPWYHREIIQPGTTRTGWQCVRGSTHQEKETFTLRINLELPTDLTPVGGNQSTQSEHANSTQISGFETRTCLLVDDSANHYIPVLF